MQSSFHLTITLIGFILLLIGFVSNWVTTPWHHSNDTSSSSLKSESISIRNDLFLIFASGQLTSFIYSSWSPIPMSFCLSLFWFDQLYPSVSYQMQLHLVPTFLILPLLGILVDGEVLCLVPYSNVGEEWQSLPNVPEAILEHIHAFGV